MSASIPVRVAGAGVLGLSVALALARRGVAVEVWDPESGFGNASGVAAGMLAAASETVLDPPSSVTADNHRLFLDALERWKAFSADIGLPIDRSGAVIPATDSNDAEAEFERFARDSNVALITGHEARALQPWLGAALQAAVHVRQDWRIEPHVALAALRSAIETEGGVFQRERLSAEALDHGPVVLATGYGGRGLAAPELIRLQPIKGQIVRLAGGPPSGATVRAKGAYIAPQNGGAIVGATMEPGLDDTDVHQGAVTGLIEAAAAVMPRLRGLPARGMAGVRASTPDGLPLVGPSSREGVFLATGARRNGWLLGPLVGRMVAAYLTGDDPGPYAARLDPRRFDR